MFASLLLTIALTAAPANVTLSAVCGGGTPESFGAGAMARDSDGAVFRIEPGSLSPGRKVVRHPAFVAGLLETLRTVDFDRIELNAGNRPWCGLTRTIGSSSHSVRWPTRLQPGGSLAHEFAGMPVQVWHVFLRLQQVGVEQQLCGKFQEEILPPQAFHGAIWMSCQGPGVVPPAAGVYVLADGDIMTWTGSPVALGRCSSIAGTEANSSARWHEMLSKARFEKLSDYPRTTRYGEVNCSIGRAIATTTHAVSLLGVGVGEERTELTDPQWKAVEQVFVEIGSRFAPTDTRLVPALRRAMTHPTRKDRP